MGLYAANGQYQLYRILLYTWAKNDFAIVYRLEILDAKIRMANRIVRSLKHPWP
jgi:hypothetical protein